MGSGVLQRGALARPLQDRFNIISHDIRVTVAVILHVPL